MDISCQSWFGDLQLLCKNTLITSMSLFRIRKMLRILKKKKIVLSYMNVHLQPKLTGKRIRDAWSACGIWQVFLVCLRIYVERKRALRF